METNDLSSSGISRIIRISTGAWALAREAALNTIQASVNEDISELRDLEQWDRLTQLAESERDKMWDDLVEAKIADGNGTISEAWLGAIWGFVSSTIAIRINATFAGMSGLSEIGITGNRALCAYQRRVIEEPVPGIAEVTMAEQAVELSLFTVENLWAGLRRVLPPVDSIRASAATGVSYDESERTVLTAKDGERIRAEASASALAQSGTAILQEATGLPPALKDLVHNEVASVAVAMVVKKERSTDVIGSWMAMWAATTDALYSLRSQTSESSPEGVDPVLEKVPSGDIAAQIIFSFMGARDFSNNSRQGNI